MTRDDLDDMAKIALGAYFISEVGWDAMQCISTPHEMARRKCMPSSILCPIREVSTAWYLMTS